MNKKKLKCVVCGASYPKPERNYTRSHYCSPKCRNRFYQIKYQKQRSIWQRARYDREAETPDPDKIQCRICGRWYRMIGGHIRNAHKMTAREYRMIYGYDVKRGQLPPDLRELKAEQAIECGGYRNLKIGKRFWFKRGQEGVGRYKRSEQTIARLQDMSARRPLPKKTSPNCVQCGGGLIRNQTKYCSARCRAEHHKIIYNKSRVKLFEKKR
jgi:predicted nucleic acid-binding Zn ribbon protein